ncbi:MAG: hypothetical protein ABJN34_04750 [Litoreibacter sp.]|uniref:hypothetical protein n=1 Tax=Litoreibacter sp. TaxID=1969459 RepID=UPI003296FECD
MIHRILFSSLLCALTSVGNATVIDGKILRQSGQGQFVILDTDQPFSVGFDTFDDDNLYAFDEDQNIELEEDINVDIGGIDGQIPSGTVIASHYVFFDSLNGIHLGYVDFDAPILGIAALPQSMNDTDYLANTSINYISTDLRGLEPGDQISIDPDDPNRLWVYWAGSSPGDYIRVFTEHSAGALLM